MAVGQQDQAAPEAAQASAGALDVGGADPRFGTGLFGPGPAVGAGPQQGGMY